MNVLIVGRTVMRNSSRCIGGIADDGTSVRLLNNRGDNWDASTPLQVGQLWDVAYTPLKSPIAPHLEDVLVSRYRHVGTHPDLRGYLYSRIQPWIGHIGHLFGGKLRYTENNNGFICQRVGVPNGSTWFWIPDRDLKLRADGKHYDYFDGIRSRGLKYVGETQPVPTLSAGTLVRVSLARWWKPENAEPDFEERCYLQLSGWFL